MQLRPTINVFLLRRPVRNSISFVLYNFRVSPVLNIKGAFCLKTIYIQKYLSYRVFGRLLHFTERVTQFSIKKNCAFLQTYLLYMFMLK